MALDDHQLLKEHLAHPDGPALGKLVTRHLPLVHSVAQRITANHEAARDISQTVFLRLVKKAQKIPPSLPLTAWFHRETHSASVDHVRSEVRRQKREETAASLDAMTLPEAPWNELAPEIDSAINELPESERALVLLRFYQEKTHREVAHELGIKEDAARMRTNRALEKLRTILSKRGLTTTAALLATTLPGNAVTPAPASLAASITASLQAVPTATSIGALAFLKTHLLTVAITTIGIAAVTTQQLKINQLESAQVTKISPSSKSPSLTNSTRTTSSRSRSAVQPDLLTIFAHPDPAERLRLLQAFDVSLPTERIPEVLTLISQNTPEWDHESKILAHLLLTRWARNDPEAAFATLDSSTFSYERGHYTSVLSALASLDPQRTARWLTTPSNTRTFYPVVGHVLAGTIAKEWSRQDPKAALAWATTLTDRQQAGAYSGVLETIAATDPQKAATLVLTLDPGEARDHVLDEIAKTWTRQSPQSALAWSANLPEHEQKITNSSIYRTWATADPEAAATSLDSQSDPGLLPVVAEKWSHQSPPAALDWIETQPASHHQNRALGTILWNWTTQDPTAATAWVQSQPAGSKRDHAIAGLATAAVEFDPAAALAWAEKISNPTIRAQIIQATSKP